MTDLRIINEHPTPTAEQLAEIEALKAQAAADREAREASFQRCDTDGFLSQWASGINAELRDRQAEILANGGCATFRVLVETATGKVIATKQFRFAHPTMTWQSVTRWRLPDDVAARAGRRWVPTGDKSRVQRSLGLEEALQWAPAYAKVTTPPGARSTGLSGCANAYVGTFRRETNEED